MKSSKSWPHKVRPVPIREMRVPPVQIIQRRFSKSQAEEYAANFDPNKLGIVAVNFRDGIYWVVDGQHRVAALKLFFAPNDPGVIDCSVYADLSDQEMAELFLGLNTRRTVNQFDNFMVSCTAERALETSIRRVVEANGLRIKQSADADCISAVSSLRRVAERHGTTVLGQSLRALRDGLTGDAKAFDGQLVVGMALVYGRFNGKTNEKRMAEALSDVPRGAATLLGKANSLVFKTGNHKTQCIAAVLVDTYNKRVGPRSSERLPSWWKEDV